MRTYIILFLLGLFLTGCTVTKNEEVIEKSEYQFSSCEEVHKGRGRIERCENKEVICYKLLYDRGGGISCKHKSVIGE